MSEAGAVIRKAREAKGVSQAELARRIGYHQSHVSHLERGRSRLDLVTATRVADALGIPRVELLSDLADSEEVASA